MDKMKNIHSDSYRCQCFFLIGSPQGYKVTTVNRQDVINTYIMLPSRTTEYMFKRDGKCTKVFHVLNYKLSTFIITEILQSFFSSHGLKLKLNNKDKNG